jgi:hypothetical protein
VCIVSRVQRVLPERIAIAAHKRNHFWRKTCLRCNLRPQLSMMGQQV